ncbi:MAG: hypothetical protein LM550_09345 [Candidatus Contendobacter sp.]|jgi:serine/threonine protein kinase|nr:hypothetical protein [Candidatus Contendobacter sp.]
MPRSWANRPEALALRWLLELCAGLGELHQHGLAHGDVSPRNIIVQGGTVVLTDYDKANTVIIKIIENN